MIELPRIPINFVDDYTPPRLGVYRFQADADAGPDTRISVACRPYGLSFTIRYEGLKPSEMGQLLKFWADIGLDSGSGFSLRSFMIPKSHPFWEKVSVWSYVEQHLLAAASINEAHWIAKEPGPVSVPVVNVHSWSFSVEEVYE